MLHGSLITSYGIVHVDTYPYANPNADLVNPLEWRKISQYRAGHFEFCRLKSEIFKIG